MDTKEKFKEDPKEYDEDKLSNNKETEDEGKKDSTAASKEKEATAKSKARENDVVTKEIET